MNDLQKELLEISDREVHENRFNELTGDFYDFFDAIYQRNSK